MLQKSILIFLACVMVACTPGTRSPADERSHDPRMALEKNWEWVRTVTPVEQLSVAHPERYTVRFSEQGRLQARFDCNSGGGSYTMTAGRVSLGLLMTTRMACPEDSMDALFMRDLARVQSFFIQGDTLFLELPMDSGTMEFRRVP